MSERAAAVIRTKSGSLLLCALIAAILLMVLSGCGGRYFHDVDRQAETQPFSDLGSLPVKEYWTGVIFNGSKIGFTHFRIYPSPTDKDLFEIHSRAYIHFRFLMMEKMISMQSHDLVDKDLKLVRFTCEHDLDGSRLRQSGILHDGILDIVRTSGSESSSEKVRLQGDIYPGSVVYLLPYMKGLKTGKKFSYQIYDTEFREVADVAQEVLAYQTSDLFSGEAFKVETVYKGQKITSWLDHQGLPLLEMALGNVLISGLETESEAKHYLVEAGLNKDETLLTFSLVKSDRPINDPAKATHLELVIMDVPENASIPSDERQACERLGSDVVCRIEAGGSIRQGQGTGSFLEPYLKPSYAVPSGNSEIRALAARITEKDSGANAQIRSLLHWMKENIEKDPTDAFTAGEVLARKKGECQGHSYLYTAFARSLGIPTRVANGIVYSEQHKGFLYHAWAESFVEGRWISVDPTFDQMPSDATHIKFIEGETPASLMPIVSFMGRIRIAVREIRYE